MALQPARGGYPWKMLDDAALAGLPGKTVLDDAGEEVGRVDDVFTFTATDVPAWAAVTVEGTRRLMPLAGADLAGDRVRSGLDREVILSAPAAEEDAVRPSRKLYEHFGLSDASLRDDTGMPATGAPTPDPGGPADENRPADDADVGRS